MKILTGNIINELGQTDILFNQIQSCFTEDTSTSALIRWSIITDLLLDPFLSLVLL